MTAHSDDLFKKLARVYSTPRKVQKLLRSWAYNREQKGETLRSAHSAWNLQTAHCLEAALVTAAILENHGYAPLVMSLESVDFLDHVIFIFKEKTGWGAVARSRLEGLHGREPRFKSLRELAMSYFDPFIDATGKLTGFGVGNLDRSVSPWRHSARNVWAVENFLIQLSHKNLASHQMRYRRGFAHFTATGESGFRQPYWW